MEDPSPAALIMPRGPAALPAALARLERALAAAAGAATDHRLRRRAAVEAGRAAMVAAECPDRGGGARILAALAEAAGCALAGRGGTPSEQRLAAAAWLPFLERAGAQWRLADATSPARRRRAEAALADAQRAQGDILVATAPAGAREPQPSDASDPGPGLRLHPAWGILAAGPAGGAPEDTDEACRRVLSPYLAGGWAQPPVAVAEVAALAAPLGPHALGLIQEAERLCPPPAPHALSAALDAAEATALLIDPATAWASAAAAALRAAAALPGLEGTLPSGLDQRARWYRGARGAILDALAAGAEADAAWAPSRAAMRRWIDHRDAERCPPVDPFALAGLPPCEPVDRFAFALTGRIAADALLAAAALSRLADRREAQAAEAGAPLPDGTPTHPPRRRILAAACAATVAATGHAPAIPPGLALAPAAGGPPHRRSTLLACDGARLLSGRATPPEIPAPSGVVWRLCPADRMRGLYALFDQPPPEDGAAAAEAWADPDPEANEAMREIARSLRCGRVSWRDLLCEGGPARLDDAVGADGTADASLRIGDWFAMDCSVREDPDGRLRLVPGFVLVEGRPAERGAAWRLPDAPAFDLWPSAAGWDALPLEVTLPDESCLAPLRGALLTALRQAPDSPWKRAGSVLTLPGRSVACAPAGPRRICAAWLDADGRLRRHVGPTAETQRIASARAG